MRAAVGIEDVTSEGNSALGFGRLLIVPAVALTLVLTLSLDSAAQPSAPAVTALAGPSRQDDAASTLYLYALSADLYEAEMIHNVSGAGPLPDWYARVDTPEEEAQVMKAWDHANWIRSDLGLPKIGLVDLRRH
jgi:hypothetical protein